MVDTKSTEFGTALGQTSRDVSNLKEGSFGDDDKGTDFVFANDRIKVRSISVIVTSQLIGSAFIIGHPVNGIIGDIYTIGDEDLGSSSIIQSTMYFD